MWLTSVPIRRTPPPTACASASQTPLRTRAGQGCPESVLVTPERVVDVPLLRAAVPPDRGERAGFPVLLLD
ncbi:hypothetical protein GCM10028789_09610 [Sinomonas halotolerans]